MSKSLYIHVPSVESFDSLVNLAREIARENGEKLIPPLKVVTVSLGIDPEACSYPSRRETMGRSQNANSSSLFTELVHYARIWSALRFDAISTDDVEVLKEFREGLRMCDEVVDTAIHNIRECIRDCNTVFERALFEGLAFFTKSLPRLGKLLDYSLHEGVKPDGFATCGFTISDEPSRMFYSDAQCDPTIRLPLFLGELFRGFYGNLPERHARDGKFISDDDHAYLVQCVLDTKTTYESYGCRLKTVAPRLYRAGVLLRHLRQLCFAFYKLEVPFDKKVTSSLLDTFCTVDASLPLAFQLEDDLVSTINRYAEKEQFTRFLERHLEPQTTANPGGLDEAVVSLGTSVLRLSEKERTLAKIARYVVRLILGSVDPREIVGKHGPGAVSTGEKGPKKTRFTRIYRKLDALYPFTEYFMFNLAHVVDDYQAMQTRLSYQDSATAKVVFVPKDSRGPRLISCEPLEIQWIQQGLMRVMSDAIESNPLSRGKVNFVDQTINQRAAWRESVIGDRATIDLKDASDRVSVALVELLFPDNWTEHLLAARSDSTLLTDGRTVELRKFAPMGSATCFPVEALCFFALSVASVYVDEYLTGALTRISRAAVQKAADSILVYGDDLVIPGKNCPGVIAALESFHLKVNTQKSYSTGFFRESCGVDAFYGINVTPVRLKRTWDGQSLPSDATLPSYVAMSNSLQAKGYLWASWEIERSIQRALELNERMLVPYTMRVNPSRLSFIRDHQGLYSAPVKEKVRFNTKKASHEVFSYVVEPVEKLSSRTGWEELLRCESTRSDHYDWDFNPNVGRAGRYAVPRSARVVMRWMPYSQE